VLERLFATADEFGLGVIGLTASPLRGPAGNVEFLALLKPDAASLVEKAAIDDALAAVPPT
jgi:predicted rRNA methylase YqxC with S4 and FtsJ domains